MKHSSTVPMPKPSYTRPPKASAHASYHVNDKPSPSRRHTTKTTASSQRRPTIDVPSSSRAANNGTSTQAANNGKSIQAANNNGKSTQAAHNGKSSYAVNNTTSSRPTANGSTHASSHTASTPKASTGSSLRAKSKQVEDTEDTQRRRSISSTTLMPGSNEQSQQSQSNESQNQTASQWINNRHIKKKVKLTAPVIEKTEEVAWAELNLLTRRWFLAYLSNTNIDEPVMGVFEGMRHDNPVYKEAKQRVSRMYKTWKNQVLKAAEAWVARWISSARPARSAALASLTSFKQFRRELQSEFDVTWLLQIFKFGVEAVDFEQILHDGITFLRCK